MKGTIRKPDIGASALSPYSMISDGGAARAMHEAGLDERHRCLDSNRPHPGFSAACDNARGVLLTPQRSAGVAVTIRTAPYT